MFTPQQVAAVEAIRTVDGLQVFGWGGRWRSSHDAMHFEIRLTPAELRRGIAARPVAEGEAEAALEHATCGACQADAEADELIGELAVRLGGCRRPLALGICTISCLRAGARPEAGND